MNASKKWLDQSSLLAGADWAAGWTTTDGPDFRSDPLSDEHQASVEILVQAVGLKSGAWVRQVHGGTILRVTEGGCAGQADALWSDQPGLGVVGRGADCPLILVGGQRSDGSRVWGFAHASWRSTVAGITTGLVLAMAESGAGPEGMKAVICPSAGPCCYEVGEEVRQEALDKLGPGAAWFFTDRSGSLIFDLWAANIAQLTTAGVREDHIDNTNHCTICGGGRFPSYRREGDDAGRLAAVIGA